MQVSPQSLYDRTVKVSERDKEWRKDVVDRETGEVTNNGEVSVDGGFDGKSLFTPYKKKPNQKVTPKQMDKSMVKKGKIKDLKK